jgi:hypothetical protein
VRGNLDDNISDLFTILNDRLKTVRRQTAAIVAATTKVGDRVRLTEIRPKSLSGATGTVVPAPVYASRRRSKQTLFVELDTKPYNRGKTVEVPASCVKVIN